MKVSIKAVDQSVNTKDKVNYQQIPEKYLQQTSREDGIEERIYQMTVRHKDFADPLNVTIIQRIRLSDKKWGQVILFSDDLQLFWENMILYYRLRFQIEFTFRDAKQFWGLEDFMNIKQKAVKNAANLSMFMVNLSRFLIDQDETYTQSISDLKTRSQAAFYVEKIIKFNPEIQKIISFEQLQSATADIGCIHPRQIAA
jgi:putative transposase